MRVISGTAKGRRLKSPPGLATRPTTDRARQTIFDILGDVEGSRVLDLFAGTGALGIEALSRGAASALFIDNAAPATAAIKANLVLTGFADVARVKKAEVGSALSKSSPSHPFDLVFLDPPYERGLAFVARIVGLLDRGGWIAPGGRVVAESEPGSIQIPPGLSVTRTRAFGRTHVTIMVRST